MYRKKYSKYRVWYYVQFQASTGGLPNPPADEEGRLLAVH